MNIVSGFLVKTLPKYFTMRRKKLDFTLEGKNARAGYLFTLPFIIGFILFMLIPIFESFRMVFSKVTIDVVNFGFRLEYTGL